MSKVEPWDGRSERDAAAARRWGALTNATLVAIAAVMILLALSAFGAVYVARYNGEIYPGVSAMDLDLGGKTPAQARELLLQHTSDYVRTPLTLRHGDRTWRTTPAELDFKLDVEPIVAQAYGRGRTGGALSQWRQRAPLIHGNVAVAHGYALSRADVEGYVQSIGANLAAAPVDSRLTLRQDGVFIATPDAPGSRLDAEAATNSLYNAVAALKPDELALPVRTIAPAQTRDAWRNPGALQAYAAVEPVELQLRDRAWSLSAGLIAGTIVAQPGQSEVVGRFDSAALVELLRPIAANVNRAPRNATLKISGARPVLTQEAAGERVVADPTVKALLAALASDHSAPVTVESLPAALTAAELAPAKQELETILGDDVAVEFKQQRLVVPTSQLAEWVSVQTEPDQSGETIVVMREPISEYIGSLAPNVYRAPVNADLYIRDSMPVLKADAVGRRLDLEASVDDFVSSLTGYHVMSLRTLAIPQTVTAADLAPAKAALDQMLGKDLTISLDGATWNVPKAQLAEWVSVAVNHDTRSANIAVKSGLVRAYVKTLAPAVYRPPVNAELSAQTGASVLSAGSEGRRLDLEPTVTAVAESLSGDHSATVAISVVPQSLTAADLAPAKETLDTLLSADLVATHAGRSWTATRQQLGGWIEVTLNRRTRSATVAIKPEPVRNFLTQLAPQVYVNPVQASLSVRNGKSVLVNESVGKRLDVNTTAIAIYQALYGGHTTTLAMSSVPYQLTAADLAPARRRLDTLLAGPITLKLDGRTWTIPVATLGSWAIIAEDRRTRIATVALDESAVTTWMGGLSPQVYRAPADGQITWDNGVKVTRPSAEGRVLMPIASASRVRNIAFTPQREVSLAVRRTQPATSTNNLPALGIREIIGEGSSEFTGSSPERVHNIHTAAGYLHNTIVPPGKLFSFNDAIGPIALDTGYQEGLTIVGDETVAGVGGGVCQVSTTAFRAAFWSGVPIVVRNQHSYTVVYYTLDGSPVGFDAAVYQPYLDLQFKNDTGKHILIQTSWSRNQLWVTFYGTKTGRTVQRSAPYITNRLPPLPDKVVVDPSLPTGARAQKDWAHEGLDVSLTRTVSKNGKVLFTERYFSRYKPWGAVYHVGPPPPGAPILDTSTSGHG